MVISYEFETYIKKFVIKSILWVWKEKKITRTINIKDKITRVQYSLFNYVIRVRHISDIDKLSTNYL